MVMDHYKLRDFGFFIDEEVAAYVHLEYDRTKGQVPDYIKRMTPEFFKKQARKGDLPEYYSVISETDGKLADVQECGSFSGEIETLLPQRAAHPIKRKQEDAWLFYLPTKKKAGLFRAAYSPERLLVEYKNRLEYLHLPEDFDWWGHIVQIEGKYLA